MEALRTNEVTINREVVLSDVINAPIYRIKEVYANEVRLVHTVDGQEVNEGFHSQSTCYHPSQEQRDYWAKQQ